MEAQERYLTDRGVEELTGIKRQSLANARHLKTGIPYYKVGRSIRYKLSDVLGFMEGHRIDPEQQEAAGCGG